MSAPKRKQPARSRPAPPPLPVTVARFDQWPVAWLVGLGVGASVFMGLAGVGIYFLFAGDEPKDSSEVATNESPDSKERNRQTARAESPIEFESPIDNAKREAAERAAAKPKPQIAKTTVVEPKESKVAVSPLATSAEINGPWDRTLAKLDGYLCLPPRQQSIGVVTSPEAVQLSQIHLQDPREIALTLYTSQGSSKQVAAQNGSAGGLLFRVEDQESDAGQNSRRWVVQRKILDSFTKLPKLAEVGTFELADENLSFLWNMETPDWAKPNSLNYCVLEISKGDQSRRFRLSTPKSTPAEPYTMESHDQRVYLAVNPNAVEDPTDLKLDLQLSGADSKACSKSGLKIGETATFGIDRKIGTGDGRVEFELTFQFDDRRPYIKVNAYTFRKTLITIDKQQQNAELTTLTRIGEPHKIPIQELRFRTCISDFERIADSSEKLSKGLANSRILSTIERLEIPKNQKLLGSLEDDLGKAKAIADLRNQSTIEAQITKVESSLRQLTDIVDECHERIKVLEDQIPWTKEMQPVFEELGKTATIRYSLYHIINGEKVYLAETKGGISPSENSDAEPKEKERDRSKPKDDKERE